MKQYLELGDKIIKNGRFKEGRNGNTIGIFGDQLRFNLQDGFPLLTTKKTIFKPMIAELLWFLEGSTDNNRLHELGAKFWDQWALPHDIPSGQSVDIMNAIHAYSLSKGIVYKQAIEELTQEAGGKDKVKDFIDFAPILTEKGFPPIARLKAGALGPIYGKQWRDFGGVDQITRVIEDLKNKPYSRRHIVSAWNPAELADDAITPEENISNGNMALSPCHCLFQFFVDDATFDERMKYFESLFSHDIVADGDVIRKRINESKHKGDFFNYEENFTEENECATLPYFELIEFARKNSINVTVYKPISSSLERMKWLENNLDSKTFISVVSLYQDIEDTSNSYRECTDRKRALFDSYGAPKSIEDAHPPEALIKCQNTAEVNEYYNQLFDAHGVPTKRLSCQLYQR